MEEGVKETGFVILSDTTIASDYALKNLNKALGEAQLEFGDSIKDAKNTYGGWKYTPLTNIIAAIRPALSKHHLTISQFPETDLERKTVRMLTRLSHWDSAEWVQNILELPAELALGKEGTPRFNQQTIGGTITYAQKYSLKPIAGIADDEEAIDSSEDKGDLPARSAKQTTEKWAAREANKNKPPSTTPTKLEGNILTGTVKEIKSGTTKAGKEYRAVVLEDSIAVPGAPKPFDTVWVWHQSMWEDLAAMPGKECEFMVATSDKGFTLNTILRIGSVEWTEPKKEEAAQ